MLLDGDFLKIEYAIKNMIGNTAGMVCDGARGCSLKVATNTSAAVQAAILANMDRCISSNDGSSQQIWMRRLKPGGFVSTGMQNADPTILSIMINKNNSKEVNHV
jgi:L-cysteine desulfidase